MKVSETILGQAHGKDVVAYTLTNPNGISLTAMTYGATITELMMPDKNGKSENVILAMDSLDDYVKHRPYYGATIGRIAGRIAKGSFDLDGTRHQLIVNEEENQLHGGPAGLDTHVWDAEIKASADEASIHFTTTDADGANGYPGNLSVTVSYTLTAENEWKINYRATTDQPTLFNPTNHVYFNLSGDINKPILQHELLPNWATEIFLPGRCCRRKGPLLISATEENLRLPLNRATHRPKKLPVSITLSCCSTILESLMRS